MIEAELARSVPKYFDLGTAAEHIFMEPTIPKNARSDAQKFHRALERLVKTPPSATEEISDPIFGGLTVRVGKRGKPAWAYRYRFQGQLYRQKLGTFPECTIAEAHKQVEGARQKLARKENPFPPEEVPAEARTVETVAKLFFKEHASHLKHGAELQRLIEKNFADKFGKHPIGSITRRDIRDATTIIRKRAQDKAEQRTLNTAEQNVVRAAEAAERERAAANDRKPNLKAAHAAVRDQAKAARVAAKDAAEEASKRAGVGANRVLMALHKFFGWCVEQDYLDVNPCTGLKPLVKEEARSRVLADAEIAAVWQACDDIGSAMGDMTKLLLLTGRRLGEVAGMRRSELNEDHSEWRLSADRAKNKLVAITPLCDKARKIIAGRTKIDECDFVFTTTGKSPVSGFSKFKRELDGRVKAGAPWRLHDIRRTVATNLQRLGVRLEVTEAVLGHVSGSRAGIVGIYQRYDWADEKRVALARWADRLDDIVAGRADAKVVTLGAAA